MSRSTISVSCEIYIRIGAVDVIFQPTCWVNFEQELETIVNDPTLC